MPRVCSAPFTARSWWFPYGGHGDGDYPERGSDCRVARSSADAGCLLPV